VYVGSYTSRIEGDAPASELRAKLSYQDPKVIEFLASGKWGQTVIKELEELKKAAEGLGAISDGRDGKMGRFKAKKKYREAKKLASTVHLYDSHTRTFPTTLLRDVLRVMRDNGIRYDLVRDFAKPEETFEFEYHRPLEHEPRAYQDEAVRIGKHFRAGVFALATNAGKTTVLERLMKERGLKTLILVQKTELMEQIHESIRDHMDFETGLVGAGEFFLRPITVAIVNSACLKIAELKEYGFDMVVVDEGHHAASKIHRVILEELQPYCRYSLTGTDFRTKAAENIILKAAFGGTIKRVTNQYMIEHGYSAKIVAEIHRVKHEDLHPSLPWREVYNKAVLLSLKRTQVLVNAVKKHVDGEKTVLVLTDETEHGGTLYHQLRAAGVNARFMHGKKHQEERTAARLDFKKRAFDVLVGTTLYDEGVDFPTLDVVALAGGKKAKGKVFQRLGRSQRRGFHKDGSRKDTAIVIDIFDEGHRTLKSHSLRRLRAMHDAGVVLSSELVQLLEKEGYLHGAESTGPAGVAGGDQRERGGRRHEEGHLLQDGGRDVHRKRRQGRQRRRQRGGEGEDASARPAERPRRGGVRREARQA
jgi:superfamily II DNA or RNA helicase